MVQRHVAPVRRRLTVLNDGTIESCAIVFCEDAVRSVPASQCGICPFCASASRETIRDRTVECDRSVLSIDGNATGSWFPPAVAANLPVGLALVRPFVCVRVELPWIDVASASVLAEEPHGAPVVDCSGRLVGLLPAAAIERAFRNAPADSFASAADCTVSAASIEETESLGSAFTMMGMRRLRELTVIDDGGIVVGVLRDVDALRFVAHVARTGQRPSECAV